MKKKPTKNKLELQKFWQSPKRLLVFVAGFILVVSSITIFSLSTMKDEPKTQENNMTKETPIVKSEPSEDGAIQIESKGLSSLCKKIDNAKVAELVGGEVADPTSSFADIKTAEGSIANCSFQVKESDDRKYRSVQFVERVFDKKDAAQKVFGGMATTNEVKDLDQGKYFLNGRTVTFLREDKLYTIVLAVQNANNQEISETLVRLLEVL